MTDNQKQLTVQQLIDKLIEVEDKTKPIVSNIAWHTADVYGIQELKDEVQITDQEYGYYECDNENCGKCSYCIEGHTWKGGMKL